jgi:hypothetical protein
MGSLLDTSTTFCQIDMRERVIKHRFGLEALSAAMNSSKLRCLEHDGWNWEYAGARSTGCIVKNCAFINIRIRIRHR